MAHITSLGLKNFRVFKEEVSFEFAPITILTGTNNSGKSSLFKALLLLADNAKNKEHLQSLDFRGELHNLGTYELAKNNQSKNDDTVIFELRIQGDFLFGLGKKPLYIKFTYQNAKINKVIIFRNKEQEDESLFFLYENDHQFIVNGEEESGVLMIWDMQELYKAHIQDGEVSSIQTQVIEDVIDNHQPEEIKDFVKIIEERMYYRIQVYTNIWAQAMEPLNHYYETYELGFYNLRLDDGNYISIEHLLDEDKLSTIQKIYFEKTKHLIIKDILETEFRDFLENHFTKGIKEFFDELHTSLNMQYLESVRANQKRIYTFQTQGTQINILLNEFINFLNIKHSQSDLYLREEAISFINRWLREFGIGHELSVKMVKGITNEVVIKKSPEDEIGQDLVDFGYGVSQFLPILLKIVTCFDVKRMHCKYSAGDTYSRETNTITTKEFKASKDNNSGLLTRDNFKFSSKPYHIPNPNGRFLLLEEPETNLHPQLQSKIADMLVDALITFDIQFIVETHSEYLIRKLQYLIAKKTLLPENIGVYYIFEHNKVPTDRKQVEKLSILADGSLSEDFGEGFFDEATKWKFELLRLKNQN
jgi:predicted ATPase